MRKEDLPVRYPRPQPPGQAEIERALAVARIYGFNSLTSADDENEDFTLPQSEADVLSAPYPLMATFSGIDVPVMDFSLELADRLDRVKRLTGWTDADIEQLKAPIETVCQIAERVYARLNDGL